MRDDKVNNDMSKPSKLSDGNNKRVRNINAKQLSRRNFLALTALGLSGFGMVSASKQAFAANPLLDTNRTRDMNSFTDTNSLTDTNIAESQNKLTQCISPNITTRIFSSSNTSVDDARNVRGLERMACAGFDIQNQEVTRRQYLRFGGTDEQRASDLQNIATGAIEAPELLLAARGGYGAMRLLELVDWESLGRVLKAHQTILVGFSDVTAVQCALLAKGKMSSLAGPMLYSEFGKAQPDIVSCQGFVEAITNPKLTLSLSEQLHTNAKTLSTPISGVIWGGNLSVVSALAGSDYLPNPDGGIVFLEDVGEQPYQVERMLYSLYLSGAFKHQQAIVLGTFTGTGSDSYDARYNMDLVVKQLKQLTGLPIYTGLHFGHVAKKQSFPLGATCTLMTNTDGTVAIEFSDYPTINSERIYAEGLWS